MSLPLLMHSRVCTVTFQSICWHTCSNAVLHKAACSLCNSTSKSASFHLGALGSRPGIQLCPVVSTWSCLRWRLPRDGTTCAPARSLPLSPSLSLSHNLWLGVENTVLSRSAWQGVQHRAISWKAHPKHVAPSQFGLEFVVKAA